MVVLPRFQSLLVFRLFLYDFFDDYKPSKIRISILTIKRKTGPTPCYTSASNLEHIEHNALFVMLTKKELLILVRHYFWLSVNKKRQ